MNTKPRDEAFEAFLQAVNRYIPVDFLEARAAIREAGMIYAHAAALEATGRFPYSSPTKEPTP